MANLGLLGGIAQGIEKGMSAYQTERGYQDKKREDAEEKALKKRMLQLQMFEKGVTETPEGGFDYSASEKEKMDLAKQKESMGLDKLGAETEKTKKETGLLGIPKLRDELDEAAKKTDIALKKSQITKNLRESAEGKIGGKTIPASEAVAIGSASAAVESLDDVKKLIGENSDIVGPFAGKVSQFAGYTGVGQRGKQAAALNSAIKQRAQVIGKYLEGGKMTDQDILRYEKMLPTITDSPEVSDSKIQSIQRMVAQKQKKELQGLAQAGFRTEDMATVRDPGELTLPSQKIGSGLIQEAQAGGKIKVIGNKTYVKVPGGWQEAQ